MAYDETLADRIREALACLENVEEKKMFRGITFMVNGKMCVSVSGENLMVRFDPALHEMLAERTGFADMVMKGKVYKGYGYIEPGALQSKNDLDYWLGLALDFNSRAKASAKKK